MGGITAAINGFQTTASAIANRNIKLARLTLVQLLGQAISICFTVVLAWYYKSVWALAIGGVVGSAVQTILGHIFLPSHGHSLRLDRKSLHSLVRFGRWIFFATLVTFIGGRGLQAIQGAFVWPTHSEQYILLRRFPGRWVTWSADLSAQLVFPLSQQLRAKIHTDYALSWIVFAFTCSL